MYMIEISEDKVCELSEHIEKGLRYLGKAMQCIDEYKEHRQHDDYDHRREDDYERRDIKMSGRGRYDRY